MDILRDLVVAIHSMTLNAVVAPMKGHKTRGENCIFVQFLGTVLSFNIECPSE